MLCQVAIQSILHGIVRMLVMIEDEMLILIVYMGLAHLRGSMAFVFVHCISCQEMGTREPPATLVPKMTPSSFAAVER